MLKTAQSRSHTRCRGAEIKKCSQGGIFTSMSVLSRSQQGVEGLGGKEGHRESNEHFNLIYSLRYVYAKNSAVAQSHPVQGCINEFKIHCSFPANWAGVIKEFLT